MGWPSGLKAAPWPARGVDGCRLSPRMPGSGFDTPPGTLGPLFPPSPCTCAVGLIDHWLHDASPGVNEPGRGPWKRRRVQRGSRREAEMNTQGQRESRQERTDTGAAKQRQDEERLRGALGPPSAPRTALGLPRRAGPRSAQASGVTHQLLTCRMVSPVSWDSCFFCSSEGYGCCGHQQESPCLPGCPLIPQAWPAQVPGSW